MLVQRAPLTTRLSSPWRNRAAETLTELSNWAREERNEFTPKIIRGPQSAYECMQLSNFANITRFDQSIDFLIARPSLPPDRQRQTDRTDSLYANSSAFRPLRPTSPPVFQTLLAFCIGARQIRCMTSCLCLEDDAKLRRCARRPCPDASQKVDDRREGKIRAFLSWHMQST